MSMEKIAAREFRLQITANLNPISPPLADQQRIPAMLNERMASTGQTRKAIEEELDAINKLPAGLSGRAFAGGL